jgi:hypothetical protein
LIDGKISGGHRALSTVVNAQGFRKTVGRLFSTGIGAQDVCCSPAEGAKNL